MHGQRDALSTQERHGLTLFRGRAGCSTCHAGPTLSDEQFHNTGVAWEGRRFRDPGRFAVSGLDADRGAFKTPTLREVARTPPYMHDGSLRTLDAVVRFYDRGGRMNPHLDPAVRPLGLSRNERHALVAFLHSLTGQVIEGGTRAER
ncbi:MAG: c-type cytochrome [Acidobacteria bacterium]|nr:c-type cytochrome [Acidobacteriota bacterium]